MSERPAGFTRRGVKITAEEQAPTLEKLPFANWHIQPPPDPDTLQRFRKARWEIVAAVATLPALVLLLGLLQTYAHLHLMGMMGGLTGIYVSFIAWATTRRAPSSVSHLLDIPPAVPQFPVRLSLAFSDQTYGRDDGVVSFVGSWMHYQGLRTNFSIDLQDRTTAPTFSLPTSSIQKSTRMTVLRFQMGSTRLSFTVTPYDSVGGIDSGLKSSFLRALSEAKQAGSGQGDLMLPPLNPQPSIIRSGSLTVALSGLVGSLLLVVVPIVTTAIWGLRWEAILVNIAFIALGTAFLLFFRSARKQLRTLQRLTKIGESSSMELLAAFTDFTQTPKLS